MDKLNELKALADLAQQLEDNGHFVEANTVHNKFIRLAQTKTHTVSSGESWSRIANEYGVSVNALKAANPPKNPEDNNTTIHPGSVLKIPAPVKEPSLMESVQKGLGDITNLFTGKKEAPKKPMAPTKKPMAPVQKPITHEVLPGQSLSMIGKQYGIPWQKIQKDNGIKNSRDLFPGQPLIIKK